MMTAIAAFTQKASRAIIFRWDNTIVPMRLRLLGIKVDGRAKFVGHPIVSLARDSEIEICDSAMLISRAFATALGVSHRIVLRTLSSKARIRIGEYSGLSGVTICAMSSVTVGPQSMLGADVLVMDTDFHRITARDRRHAPIEEADFEPVTIGTNVFIGARSIVLKGVSIGDNSVIGAGSVVSASVPANVVAAGNPCRVIKSID
jgi:acetyltransferase-like isoleucine patch superfamily enzyme